MLRAACTTALIAAALLPLHASAQEQQRSVDIRKTGLAYAHFGIGAGFPHTFRAGADFILKGRHELTIGYTGMARKSPGVPAGAQKLGGLLQLTEYPQETFSGLALGYGYIWYLPKSGYIRNRLVLRASLLLGTRDDLSNVQVDRRRGTISYTYERSTFKSAGLLVEPRLQLIANRGFGMETGPYIVLTDHMLGAGLSVNMLFGYVSNYRRPVPPLGRQRQDFHRKHPFRRFPQNLR